MFRAIYDFNSSQANILSFQKGDYFVDRTTEEENHDRSKIDGWIWVVNRQLQWGFVPATYVVFLDSPDLILEDKGVKLFIEDLWVKVRDSMNSVVEEDEKKDYKELQKELLQYMQLCSNNLNENVEKNQMNHLDILPKGSPRKAQNKLQPENKWQMHETFGLELVEYVKSSTSLPHRQAKQAIEAALGFLEQRIPAVQNLMEAIRVNLTGHSPSMQDFEKTHDWVRLKNIFGAISDVKNDTEQINWALYEDLHIILEFLEELISILTDGDLHLNKSYLKKDQYRGVEALVQYFHMEPRQAIRQMLLKVFGALCSTDRVVISILASSDLPQLLAKEIQETNEDNQKLCYTCIVLTMLLWTGEPLPIHHYDILGCDFINHILDLIENPPSDDDADKIQDTCIELLLVFNIQFSDFSNNVILKGLISRETAPEFLRKLIVLANREDDPIRDMFDHKPRPPNSVHKILLDIFSTKESADLFYTNDLKVLIEIVIRKLKDLPSSDEDRSRYIQITRSIIKNTNYEEHLHCYNELKQIFSSILSEEVTSNYFNDKEVVQSIYVEFPDLFSDN